jgi:hypothetical protein
MLRSLTALSVLLCLHGVASADAFDYYFNEHLAKLTGLVTSSSPITLLF